MSYDDYSGYSGSGSGYNDENSETDMISIQTLPSDLDPGGSSTLLNQGISDSGFVMTVALPQGLYRVEISAKFKIGWIVIHKIKAFAGQCNTPG